MDHCHKGRVVDVFLIIYYVSSWVPLLKAFVHSNLLKATSNISETCKGRWWTEADVCRRTGLIFSHYH